MLLLDVVESGPETAVRRREHEVDVLHTRNTVEGVRCTIVAGFECSWLVWGRIDREAVREFGGGAEVDTF